MKISLIPVACLAVFTISTSGSLSVAADAPAVSVVGRYEVPGQKDSFFEFRPDGTCIMSFLGEKHTVNYTVNGNAVTLTSPGNERSLVFQFANGVLTGPDGGHLARVGDAAATAAVAQEAAGVAAKNAGVSGRYGLPGGNLITLELRPDGNYTLVGTLLADAGSYTVKGGTVTLTSRANKLPTVYELSNGILSENGEPKLARMDYVAPPPGPANAGGKAGRYSCPGKLDTYLDVRADGTFTLAMSGQMISGTYSVNGAKVALKSPDLAPTTLPVENGFVTGPDGGKWPRIWEAGPPPAAAVTAAKRPSGQVAAPAAGGAGGVVGRYAMAGHPANYIEIRPDGSYTLKQAAHDIPGTYSVDGNTVTLKSYVGYPLVVRIDNGILTTPNGQKYSRAGDAGPAPRAKPSREAAPSPTASSSANPAPAAGAPPPEGVTITLSPQNAANGKRYCAGFPPGQMPPNPQSYFWVVDRPDNQTKVSELHNNEWHFSAVPGVYKIHVEYRSGNVNKTVSNVLEVTVPGAAAPAH